MPKELGGIGMKILELHTLTLCSKIFVTLASERHKSRDESQRTVGLPRGSCTLADPMGGSLSLRSQLENQRGTTLFFKLQGSSLMHWLDSRMRNGILTTRNDVSPHKVHLALRSPNSRGAQDQGRTTSAKLSGATST